MLQDGSWLAWRKVTHYFSYPSPLVRLNFTSLVRHSLGFMSSEMFPRILFSLPLYMVRNDPGQKRPGPSLSLPSLTQPLFVFLVKFLDVRNCKFYSPKSITKKTIN